jgi:hypothetical protein
MSKFADWMKTTWGSIPEFTAVSIGTLMALLLGFGVLIIPYSIQGQWRDVATPLLGAFACLASGGVVGFLFGLPRVSARDDRGAATPTPAHVAPHPPARGANAEAHPPDAVPAATVIPTPMPPSPRDAGDRPDRLRVSRNLEEIADWLTKIVVGLGLVELKNIPGYLESMTAAFVADLGPPCNQSYAMGLIVYFAVMGFLYGYLATRMFVSGGMDRADSQLSRPDRERIAVLEEKLTTVHERGKLTDTKLDEQKEATLINAGVLAWYHFHPGEPGFETPYSDLKEMVKVYPDHRVFNIVFGNLNMKKRDLVAAIKVAEDAIQAIEARRGVQDPAAVTDVADFRFNLACYRAQMHEDLTDPAKKKAYLDSSFSDLAKSLEKSPANYRDAVTDHDLDPIRRDPRYRPILDSGVAEFVMKIQETEASRTDENKRQKDKELSDHYFGLARCLAQQYAMAADAEKAALAAECIKHLKLSRDLRLDEQDKLGLLKKAKDEADFAPLLALPAFTELIG